MFMMMSMNKTYVIINSLKKSSFCSNIQLADEIGTVVQNAQ